jgi:hypothetical protein
MEPSILPSRKMAGWTLPAETGVERDIALRALPDKIVTKYPFSLIRAGKNYDTIAHNEVRYAPQMWVRVFLQDPSSEPPLGPFQIWDHDHAVLEPFLALSLGVSRSAHCHVPRCIGKSAKH